MDVHSHCVHVRNVADDNGGVMKLAWLIFWLVLLGVFLGTWINYLMLEG